MKKNLIFAIWLLAVHQCFIAVEVSHAQAARNPQGTLYGENMGDGIVLRFDINDSATGYIVYRSTSLTGPWEINGRFTQAAAITGGAKEDLTPDASSMDLCYKVEALDATGLVIEFYDPICVPKACFGSGICGSVEARCNFTQFQNDCVIRAPGTLCPGGNACQQAGILGLCDHRSPDMFLPGSECRPCALEMNGVVVTVTDSAGAKATATVTTNLQ